MTEKEIATHGPMAQMKVVIDDEVYQKINHWVQKAPGEVSGLGKVSVDKDGTFRVVEAILVEQENGSASTELNSTAVSKAMYELRDAPGHMNFWWHSHVNMAVFWSGTDIDTIREIGRNGWVLSIVFNKRRERLSALYFQETEVLPEIFLNEVSTSVSRYLDSESVASWNRDYEEKCKEKKWINPSNWQGYGDGWNKDSKYDEYDDYSDRRWSNDWVKNKSGTWRMKTSAEIAEEVKAKSVKPLSLPFNPSSNDSEANIDLFLGSIEKDIQDIETQNNYKAAFTALGDVNKIIDDDQLLTKEEKLAIKQEVVTRFNLSREANYVDRMDA